MTVAIRIAEDIGSVRLESIPEEAIRAAKRAIADTVGVTLAGSRMKFISSIEEALGADVCAGPSTKIGRGGRASPLNAALINGVSAHALDFDDCSTTMGGHPSAPIVPALIALGEDRRSNGADILQAYIAGFEAETRLAGFVMPRHYEKGWHPTSTLGIFGAAAACGRLMNLNVEGLATALAIATSLAGGIKSNFGTPVKPLHIGKATHDGLFAALLAERGVSANLGAFEHSQGFFKVFNGEGEDLDGYIATVGGDRKRNLGIVDPGISVKQHPCCGSAHSAVDAASKLHKAYGPIDPNEVAKIEVLAHQRRLDHTNRPRPQSGLDAKFSMQFLTSKTLLTGILRLGDFADEGFMTSDVRDLSERVAVIPHDGADEFRAEVRVHMIDGSVRTATASTRLGRGADNPMSVEELQTKFLDCASEVLGHCTALEIFDDILHLEEMPDIIDLTARLMADS